MDFRNSPLLIPNKARCFLYKIGALRPDATRLQFVAWRIIVRLPGFTTFAALLTGGSPPS